MQKQNGNGKRNVEGIIRRWDPRVTCALHQHLSGNVYRCVGTEAKSKGAVGNWSEGPARFCRT